MLSFAIGRRRLLQSQAPVKLLVTASTPKPYEAIIQVEAILGQTITQKVVVYVVYVVYGSVQDTARTFPFGESQV
jgi:hypothetical protein